MSKQLKTLHDLRENFQNEYLFDQTELLDLILISYLAGGHVLIEGPPGTAKTMTARILAKRLAKDFKRIQFTTDLLPADILGAQIYSPENQSFKFIEGPLFSDFVIADEINRAPPRTQSALLEAMAEKQVTIEGITRRLSPDFFVIATENPRDFEGTFPLPEVQLDRFLMKIKVANPSPETSQKILRAVIDEKIPPHYEKIEASALDLASIRSEIKEVKVDDSILSYITQIVAATQSHDLLQTGAGVRAAIALARSVRVKVYLSDRDFVTPEDIKSLAPPVLRHRVQLNADASLSELDEDQVIERILNKVEFPR